MTTSDPSAPLALLLHAELSPAEAERLLGDIGFADPAAAARSLRDLAADETARAALLSVLPNLLQALRTTAQPDRVLVSLGRFFGSLINPSLLMRGLADEPRLVEILVTVFAGSHFLAEILLRNPGYFARLVNRRDLAEPKPLARYLADAHAAANGNARHEERLDGLRRYQRWELLRIGTADLLDLFDLPMVVAQLSHLADALIQVCLELVAAELGVDAGGFVVLAMGKLGGNELNYSSDIDLLFLCTEQSDRYRALGERLVDALGRVTGEGFLYRVDMRLRPWGRTGALVSSFEGYRRYFEHHARHWERQALLRGRAIAGNIPAGEQFLASITPDLYTAAAEDIRADVLSMKQRTESELRRQGRDWGEVKLGAGSIRDVEFIAQYLQMAHGDTQPGIRSPNTPDALRRLQDASLLSAADFRILADGYTFLRTVEHHLQLMNYQQTYTLPGDARALNDLAHRLRFAGDSAGKDFVASYEAHSAAIRRVYRAHMEGEPASASTTPDVDLTPAAQQHLTRMIPAYRDTFSIRDIQRHTRMAGRLNPDVLVQVEADDLGDGNWRVTIVAYDYPGELSFICGLLFVFGFSIQDGHVFTYLPEGESAREGRRKIVDVFSVHTAVPVLDIGVWDDYASELAALLRMLEQGQRRPAQARLVKRVALSIETAAPTAQSLAPIEIDIDNDLSQRYTVLEIAAPDTMGFLYEFTNALALRRVNIDHMVITTEGQRVRDTLFVTDRDGHKIAAPTAQNELRAAAALVKQFTHLLPNSPDPALALAQFRDLMAQFFADPDWPAALTTLHRPEVLDALARLLGGSDFLWSDFLRIQYESLFPVIADVDDLVRPRSRSDLRQSLAAALAQAGDEDGWIEALNRFKDREMFRADMRHILGHNTLHGSFAGELSTVAEVVIEAAYAKAHTLLRQRYGQPFTDIDRPCVDTLVALGKFGGRELGFASDIELMVLFDDNGETSGPQVVTSAEYYNRLVQTLMRLIRSRREGIFELDLRLRPYGNAGALGVPLALFRSYFAPDGPAWPFERQALIRLRPVTGDAVFGREVAALRDDFVYTGEFDVTQMRAMRERQVRHLVTAGTLNPKFSPGGLADVEYLVQALQIIHGKENPLVRLTNTRIALAALAESGYINADDQAALKAAHQFLRSLINALRMVRGNAKDVTVPPTDSEEFDFLARRLGYRDRREALADTLRQHMHRVEVISRRRLVPQD